MGRTIPLAWVFLLVSVGSAAAANLPKDRACVRRCGSELNNCGAACYDEARTCLGGCELGRELSQTVTGCIMDSRDSGALACLGAITIVEAHNCAKICVNPLTNCREACGRAKDSCSSACPERKSPSPRP